MPFLVFYIVCFKSCELFIFQDEIKQILVFNVDDAIKEDIKI